MHAGLSVHPRPEGDVRQMERRVFPGKHPPRARKREAASVKGERKRVHRSAAETLDERAGGQPSGPIGGGGHDGAAEAEPWCRARQRARYARSQAPGRPAPCWGSVTDALPASEIRSSIGIMVKGDGTATAKTCVSCGAAFTGHPLARYCSRRCRQAQYRRRKGGPETGNRHRAPAAAIDRAVALMRRGYSVEVAASTVGLTSRTIRNQLRARGLTTKALRPADVPILLHRYPCRYCDASALHPNGVCSAAVCRTREWESLSAEERQARIARTRRPSARERTYAGHVAEGTRVDVHVLLPTEAAEQLREQAAIRQQSISSLVAGALAEVGLIREA